MYNRAMQKRYSISQARANLPSIVDRVEGGESVELTRRGKPVAAVISIQDLERLRARRASFSTAYGRFLGQWALEDVGVEDGFFDAARDAGLGRDVDL